MGFRTVYGNSIGENGWPFVDDAGCTWVDIPGTDPVVRIQIQNGIPLLAIRAWVADWNEYIEPVRDADTAMYRAKSGALWVCVFAGEDAEKWLG